MENEEVVFSYKNFAGMSESVKLSTIVSFRLTSLVLGGVLFCSAKGPGKVIFITLGKPRCLNGNNKTASFPVGRALAWRRTAKFDVKAANDTINVFLSGFNIVPSEPDMVIIDADRQGDTKKGLIKWVGRLLVPV